MYVVWKAIWIKSSILVEIIIEEIDLMTLSLTLLCGKYYCSDPELFEKHHCSIAFQSILTLFRLLKENSLSGVILFQIYRHNDNSQV